MCVSERERERKREREREREREKGDCHVLRTVAVDLGEANNIQIGLHLTVTES